MAYCLQTFGSTHLQAMLHIERFLGRSVAFPPGTPQCVVVLSGQPHLHRAGSLHVYSA